MKTIDCLIIGGGPAGLAAAVALYEKGITDILIVEREKHLGGILRQCIHDGFGLTRFETSLSGPEYAKRFIDLVHEKEIPFVINTYVTEISPDKKVTLVSPNGIEVYQAKSIILAMGCRERTRGALGIPGERPTGVFTAGVAQSYINLHNTMVGKKAIILGSGDIGMIMARRLTLEGTKVEAVFEIQPYPSGLPRNIQQCLDDYDIPLHLSHTVVEIHGNARLQGITVAKVDEALRPIAGTERYMECDTLILSVGLLPENDLSIDANITLDSRTKGALVDEFYATNIEGVFAAGNVLHVHDLVDFVSLEAERLASGAHRYLIEGTLPKAEILITTDQNINHTVPQKITGTETITLSLRVKKPFQDCTVQVLQNGAVIASKKMKKAIPAEMIQLEVEKEKMTVGNLEVKIV